MAKQRKVDLPKIYDTFSQTIKKIGIDKTYETLSNLLSLTDKKNLEDYILEIARQEYGLSSVRFMIEGKTHGARTNAIICAYKLLKDNLSYTYNEMYRIFGFSQNYCYRIEKKISGLDVRIKCESEILDKISNLEEKVKQYLIKIENL